MINISGANGLTQVFSIDGRLVFSSEINGDAAIKVNSGMYLVRCSGAVSKVLVF